MLSQKILKSWCSETPFLVFWEDKFCPNVVWINCHFLCLFLLAWLRVEVVDVILYFVRLLKLFWISLSAMYTGSICPAPARFLCQSAGDWTWSITLQLHAILVGNAADWSFHIMGSSAVIHKIQRIYRVYITVHIYCLITCYIKSLLNVPKISYISRKISQVSRFLAKSPDSRNKFVFLPKQPLLELSPPVPIF